MIRSLQFLSKNPTTTPRSRHIEISYYFVRDPINKEALKIEYIPMGLYLANGFTKTLGKKEIFWHKEPHKLVSVQVIVIATNLLACSSSSLREDVKINEINDQNQKTILQC